MREEYNEFLGTGINLPWSLKSGGIKRAKGFDHLHQSILAIILTPRGTRVMRPWFGSNLWKYIDKPVNRKNLALMRNAIYQGLKEETRGKAERIHIKMDENQEGWINISVTMKIENRISVAFNMAYDRDKKRWLGVS